VSAAWEVIASTLRPDPWRARALAAGWDAHQADDFLEVASRPGARVVHVDAHCLALITGAGALQCQLRAESIECLAAANRALATYLPTLVAQPVVFEQSLDGSGADVAAREGLSGMTLGEWDPMPVRTPMPEAQRAELASWWSTFGGGRKRARRAA
jgi:hypothetical protein